MNKNVLYGTLVGGIVSFFGGWLVFGMLLGSFYEANTVHYEGLMYKKPIMWSLVVFNLLWGWVFAYVLDLANVRDMMKGAMISGMLALGILGAINVSFHAFMNLYSPMHMLVDTVVGTVFFAVVGAVIGWLYGFLNKKGG